MGPRRLSQEARVQQMEADDRASSLKRYNFEVHGKQLKYSDRSLFLFHYTNPLRRRIVWLIESRPFDYFILAVIVANSIVLGLADYGVVQEDGDLSQRSWRNKLVEESEPYFTGIFTLECVLKVIGMGFVLSKGSYLRDGWNVLDFIVVVAGLLAALPFMPNVSAFRTIRVLRPLRSLTVVPGMRLLVMSLLGSIPALISVIMLMAFVFTIFGILGVQLWSGQLHARCRYTQFPVQLVGGGVGDCALGISDTCQLLATTEPSFGERAAGDPLNMLVSDQLRDDVLARCLEGDNDAGDDKDSSVWATPRGTGTHKCPSGRWCGSNFDDYGNQRFTNPFVGKSATFIPDLNFGFTNFDTIFRAANTIFQSITMEGWVDVMYQVMDAHIGVVAALYFVLLILFGSFFLLNLTLAVIWDNFSESQDTEAARREYEDRKAEAEAGNDRAGAAASTSAPAPAAGAGGSGGSGAVEMKAEPGAPPVDAADLEAATVAAAAEEAEAAQAAPPRRPFPHLPESYKAPLFPPTSPPKDGAGDGADSGPVLPTHTPHVSTPSRPPVGSRVAPESAGGTAGGGVGGHGRGADGANDGGDGPWAQSWRNSLYRMVTATWFTVVIGLLIVINTVVLAADHHPMDPQTAENLEITNFVLTLLFAVEMVLKLAGLGLRGYVSDALNVFDGIIVVVSLLELALATPGFLTGDDTESSTGAVSALRTFRLFRIFKFARNWRSLRTLLATIVKTLKDVGNFAVLLLLFMYIFSLVGMQFFANKFCFDPVTGEPSSNQGQPNCPDEYPRAHFDDLLWAFVTVFQILTGENWNTVMYDGWRATTWAAVLYFVSLVVLGNFIVLNLFLAILLGNFEGMEELVSPDPAPNSPVKVLSRITKYLSSRLSSSLGRKSQLPVTSPSTAPPGPSAASRLSAHATSRPAPLLAAITEDNAGATETPGHVATGAQSAQPPSTATGRRSSQELTMRSAPLPGAIESPEGPQGPAGAPAAAGPAAAGPAVDPAAMPSLSAGARPNSVDSKATSRPPLSPTRTALSPGSYGGAAAAAAAAAGGGGISTPQPGDANGSTSLPQSEELPPSAGSKGSGLDSPSAGPGGPGSRAGGGAALLSPGGLGSDLHRGSSMAHSVMTTHMADDLSPPPVLPPPPVVSPGAGSHAGSPAVASPGAGVGSGGNQAPVGGGTGVHPSSPVNGGKPLVKKPSAYGSTSGMLNSSKTISTRSQPPASLVATAAASGGGAGVPGGAGGVGAPPPSTVGNVVMPGGPRMLSASQRRIGSSSGGGGGGGATGHSKNVSIGTTSVMGSGVVDDAEDEDDALLPHVADAVKHPPLVGRALCLLDVDHPVRLLVAHGVRHPWFDNAILFLIFLSSILLAVDNPLLDPDSALVKVLYGFDVFFAVAFSLEMVLKVVTWGFIVGPHTYMRSGWNVLDFTIVVISILSLAASGNSSLNSLRSLRTLRALRPLRVISRRPGLRLIVNALFSSMNAIVNVLFVCALFFLIFGIVGVNYFKGTFLHCAGDGFDGLDADVVAVLESPVPYADLAPDMQLFFAGTGYPSAAGDITGRRVCGFIAEAGEDVAWEEVIPENFDNILAAMGTLFEMATTEGWVDIMLAGVDARGIDAQPIRDANPAWVFFFIAFMIVGSFFVLNLFVGVVIDNFNTMKERIGGSAFLTDAQREWVRTRKLMNKIRPLRKYPRPRHPVRAVAYDLAQDTRFEIGIMVCIMLNTITMAMQYFGQPDAYGITLDVLNFIFAFIFTVEAAIKITGLWTRYFYDSWNVFDFSIVVGTILGIVLQFALGLEIGSIATIVRTFRVGRVFRLVKRARRLNQLFQTLLLTLPSLGNIGGLLFLLFFIYAVMGVQLFAPVMLKDSLNDQANFQDFWTAVLTLMRSSTGEAWNYIMYDLAKSPEGCIVDITDRDYSINSQMCGFEDFEGCVPLAGCGTAAAYPYFISFTLLITFIFLNLFIAVILEGFSETNDDEVAKLSSHHLEQYAKAWSTFDPDGTGEVYSARVVDLLQILPEPMGFGTEYHANKVQLRARLGALDLDIHGNKVNFWELATALAKRVFEDHAMKEGTTFRLPPQEEHAIKIKRKASKSKLVDLNTYFAAQSIQKALLRYHARAKRRRAGLLTPSSRASASGTGGGGDGSGGAAPPQVV